MDQGGVCIYRKQELTELELGAWSLEETDHSTLELSPHLARHEWIRLDTTRDAVPLYLYLR